MADTDATEKRDHGLLPDEEQQLARECLRQGSWPRTVTIERTGTVYEIPNRHKARQLLKLLGIGGET